MYDGMLLEAGHSVLGIDQSAASAFAQGADLTEMRWYISARWETVQSPARRVGRTIRVQGEASK